jgi:hypothetical protein
MKINIGGQITPIFIGFSSDQSDLLRGWYRVQPQINMIRYLKKSLILELDDTMSNTDTHRCQF